jgi:6-pyruvoyltetrahydropterin/6-carboxytetrahydropterin synthase
VISVCKTFEFESAHRLPCHPSSCSRLHGHSYKLEVEVYRDDVNTMGMVIDFHYLKTIVNEVIVNKYDHQTLNDFWAHPTAENMVGTFVYDLKKVLPDDVLLKRLRLWETSTSYAEWTNI